MGTDNYTMGPGQLYIMDEASTFMIDAPAAECRMDIPLSAEAEPDYNFEFRAPLVQEFMGMGYLVDEGLLRSVSEQPQGFYLEYYADIQIQARRHRKKRIDKKWLKRYGYKTVRRKIRLKCDQLTMTPDDDDMGVRFDVEGVKV